MRTKKPIAPILKKMEIEDIEGWAKERYYTIINAVHRVQLENKKKFQVRSNYTTVEVKRIR